MNLKKLRSAPQGTSYMKSPATAGCCVGRAFCCAVYRSGSTP
ncbi:hypothetical protein HMPREF9413_0459 [Paenibacillus sp. HGF7]|nr:hypothetical protein HMPREF9413_0459 [Paenibacillus sp. HGF7]